MIKAVALNKGSGAHIVIRHKKMLNCYKKNTHTHTHRQGIMWVVCVFDRFK